MATTTELPTLLEGFRLYCLAEGKQPTTILWYMGKLKIFLRYLRVEHLPLDAAELTTTDLRAFLVHLKKDVRADENNPMKPAQERALSPKTIQGYARTLKAFFSWLAREGYVRDNPATLLKIPKAPKVIIQTLNDSQIRKLLSVIDRKRPKGFRDYCIVLVFLDTGVRLSELVGLQVTDLDLDRAFFKVMGKGARERLVPFGARVQTALWKYLHRFRPERIHPNVGEVFLRSDGRPLSGGQVCRAVRMYGREARIEGVRCSPHTLRHTLARSFLINGG